jgi:CheY-like chemotaxis protein
MERHRADASACRRVQDQRRLADKPQHAAGAVIWIRAATAGRGPPPRHLGCSQREVATGNFRGTGRHAVSEVDKSLKGSGKRHRRTREASPVRRALIIEENPISRSVLCTLLREKGYVVNQASRLAEATRLVLSDGPKFDVIFSEYHFAPRGNMVCTGRDWLDAMRQARSIPLATSVVMVTGEARYQCVADSVENALDDYLLKPFSAAQLHERLSTCMSRRHALRTVYAAIQADDFALAARLCEGVFAAGGAHRLSAARLGSELYLRMGQHEAALRLLQGVLEAKAVPWARLGLAQVQVDTQNAKQACRTLESLISDEPAYSDAYDMLGRALIEDLRFDRALDTYAKAVSLTPGNVVRLQKLGSLELFLGQCEAAFQHLHAAMVLGASSPALDYQSLFQLCVAGHDLGRAKAWKRPLSRLDAALESHPQSYRLRMLGDMTRVFAILEAGNIGAAANLLAALMREGEAPAFDFELACDLLQLLSRTEASRFQLAGVDRLVNRLSARFAVSRQALEMLVMAGAKRDTFEPLLRQGFEQVNQLARAAMLKSLDGDAASSIAELIAAASTTHNCRLVVLAHANLGKHRDSLGEALFGSLLAEALELQETYCTHGAHANPSIRGLPRTSAPAAGAPGGARPAAMRSRVQLA